MWTHLARVKQQSFLNLLLFFLLGFFFKIYVPSQILQNYTITAVWYDVLVLTLVLANAV
jgi:hypothetical protein